jgi:hypothetical protein
VMARALALAFRGHRELVLENLAVRQQLTAVTRGTRRSHLQTREPTVLDRLGPHLAELADGPGARAAGHRRCSSQLPFPCALLVETLNAVRDLRS